jgi:outer membrane protein OmpA-like peptidoglycan-associated protein
MNTFKTFPMAIVALAVLAGCAAPAPNARLEQARSDYATVQASPQASTLASSELKQASDALIKADAAWTRGDKPADVDNLAYLAQQRITIAKEAARLKSAEQAVVTASAGRDKLRLDARTQEADAAQRSAEQAKAQAQEAQRLAAASQSQASASQLQADAAQRQANETLARNSQLEALIKDLNAKKTDRGLVITIGDVLFDTDRAQLKPGGMRDVDKLVAFMTQYPQRNAMVEGFTDNTGSESHNQDLSVRRADTVRMALVERGVGRERIAAKGLGQAFPVAGNDSSGGRQLNRRVEITLSDDGGKVLPR